jgi:hypothetical protein
MTKRLVQVRGLWITEDDRGDPDMLAVDRLRDAMNAEAVAIGASDLALVATVSLLAAQLCNKHCGGDEDKQNQFIDDIVGGMKSTLVAHGFRKAETQAQQYSGDAGTRRNA